MVGPILSAKNKGPLNENVIKRFYFVYLKVRNYFYVIKRYKLGVNNVDMYTFILKFDLEYKLLFLIETNL